MTDDCGALEYGATLHRPDPLTLTGARERAGGLGLGGHTKLASWLLFQILFWVEARGLTAIALMGHFRRLKTINGEIGSRY